MDRYNYVLLFTVFIVGILNVIIPVSSLIANASASDIPGYATSGLLAMTDPDDYGNMPYGEDTYSESHTFTHTYTICDEYDCYDVTEEHKSTFSYKYGYQLYLYQSGDKYTRVVVTLYATANHNDESASWTCFSGHRVADTWIWAEVSATSFFLPSTSDSSTDWFIPAEGIYKEISSTTTIGLTAGLGYQIVSWSIGMTVTQSANVPYGVTIYKKSGERPYIEWIQKTLSESNLNSYGIVVKPSGGTACDGSKHAYLREHKYAVWSVAFQLVKVPSGEYYPPGWIRGYIWGVDHWMWKWTLWGICSEDWGIYYGDVVDSGNIVFEYYLNTYSW